MRFSEYKLTSEVLDNLYKMIDDRKDKPIEELMKGTSATIVAVENSEKMQYVISVLIKFVNARLISPKSAMMTLCGMCLEIGWEMATVNNGATELEKLFDKSDPRKEI